MLSPFIWAFVNHIDKYAVEKYMHDRDPGALLIFTGLAAFVMGLVIWVFGLVSHLPASTFSLMIVGGVILVFSYLPYLYALKRDEASNVAPLYQLITPLAYVLALIFLGEHISGLQLFAGAMIFSGSVVLSFDFATVRIRTRTFFLMFVSSLMIAANVVIFKHFAVTTDFWTTAFYDLVGATIAGVILFFIPSYRHSFIGAIRQYRYQVVGVNMFAEIINIFARLINGFVSMSLPIAIVQFVNGLQPLFILVIGITLTKLAPRFGKEAIDRSALRRKFAAIILMVGGLALLSFFV